ncbi:Myosin type-2 heavy chain 1 [Lambiella insularis]|nr:Myosin type-2 heavy chain 1 [Lambiella insularis]
MAHNYDVGTRAWQPDPTEGWVASQVEHKEIHGDKVTIIFQLENGETRALDTSLAALQSENSDSLPPLMNPAMLEASDDLTNLSHLNEPAVLQAIKLRYLQKEIYTYSGIVLIATNPFARVDSLYVPGMVQVYAGKPRASQAPHLFAIAEEAFIDMMRDKHNQTIVVSGESGAGKTVSAKYIMRYFATRESPDQPGKRAKGIADAMSETEEQILATNPVMEAFGNAKTTRNDNSSRFGKYIEIMFDKRTEIIGAKIRTYLLERSRLVFQPLRERNYHIFYQLVAGATPAEREELGLVPVEHFDYLNQGGAPDIEGVDDKAEFDATRHSLNTIGVSAAAQSEIFRLLAALLHLGNVKITATRTDSALSPYEPSLIKACQLLGVDATEFAKWVVKKQLITRGERIVSNLTQQQAIVVRDSVAKFIYSSLFDWLVETINRGLATDEVLNQATSFIGVLDIYGFEHFAKNSFEQFCINYANEKLQQEFNAHVFKLEQEEYIREEIDWTFINFSDNQPCIDLIEGKLGILSLLDEESRLPMGSDEQFVTKLHHIYAADKQRFYKKPRFGKSAFTVCHYATDVTYESDGFIEKNRDTVPDEQLEILRMTTNAFLGDVLEAAAIVREKDLAAAANAKAANAPGRRMGVAASRKPTLGGIFKSSLVELMQTINSTDAHYIRCIKPNEGKAAWKFEGPMVLSQLRACGVLETVRISCAGYPTRWTYEEFALRYYMLVPSKQWTSEIRAMANAILKKALGQSHERGLDKYQLGLTKIFFRAGMLAFLENLRTKKLNESAIMIQKNLRCKYYRRKFLEARQSILTFQAVARGHQARMRAEEVRKTKAATVIQTLWRGQKERRKFNDIRQNIILFQSITKGFLCRRHITETRIGNAAQIIQRSWRSRRQMRSWRQYRKKIVIIQSLWRGLKARRGYQTVRAEARDLKEISYKLENKVVELTQSVGSLKQENKALISQLESYENQVKSWRTRHNALESRSKELQAEANQAGITAARLTAMEEEMARLQLNYDEAVGNVKRLQEEEKSLREAHRVRGNELEQSRQTSLAHENEKKSLRQQLAELQDQLVVLKQAPPLPAVNGELTNGHATAPQVNGLINLVSSKKPKRRSAGAERIEMDRFSGAYNPRPTSMAVTGPNGYRQNALSPAEDNNVEYELVTLLADEDGLNDEITLGLIKALKIPVPTAAPPPSDKEVLFPSYLINLVTSEMWNNGFVKESERFLANVMQSIQQEVMQHEGDEAVVPGAFWLSNVHEILSFVFLAEDWYEAQKDDNYEYARLLEIVKHDLESLEFNIYHTWMKVLKKKLQKMIVPAIIESQSLPGFVTSESNRFLGKLLQTNSTPAFSMDNLLSLLNNVFRAMKAFYLEESIIVQAVTELLRLVGVTAFNDLLMRRNFLSWKRGLQINYNITRIEEWCKSHDMPEGTLQLEHLMQATKLLQLKKATLNDIEIIQDICWMLSPNQIQKLLNQYLVADYEQPINGEIMKAVASRVTEKGDVLLLTAVDMEDSGPYEIAEPRVITALETYTPSWLQTPRLKRLAEIVSAQAMAQQETLEFEVPRQEADGEPGPAVDEVEVTALYFAFPYYSKPHLIRWNIDSPRTQTTVTSSGSTDRSIVGIGSTSQEEWLSGQNLTYPFRYSHRVITTRPVSGLRRPSLTKLDSTLFDTPITIESIEDVKNAEAQPLTLEIPAYERGPVNASHLSFGIQTIISRLEDSVPQLARWLANTSAKLYVVLLEAETVPVNTGQMAELEERMRDQGIDVILSAAREGDTFPQRYFSLVSLMYEQRTSQTRWIDLIDDDTFFPSMPALLAMLDKYDTHEQHYIGSLSEDWWAVSHYGLMGFGGAGVFLSLPLAKVLAEHTESCHDNLRSSAGDITVMDCIYTHTSTKLTPVRELHQHDIQGDPSGLYESGRRHLSLHHWKAGSLFGRSFPMAAMHLVADVCGECFLQRWQFADDTILSNGYSIATYPKGHVKSGTQNEVNMEQMEETWNHNMDVRNSLGPTRPRLALETEKIQYNFLNATVMDGGVRQLYLHPGVDGDLDTILELFWKAESSG